MKPVDQVLAAGMKIFLKLSHGVAAIGEEDYLLVLLHSLRFEQFPQTATGLLIVSLNKSEALGRGRFVGFLPTERYHALAGNHLTLLCEPLERSHHQFQLSSGHRATAAFPNPDVARQIVW